MAETVREAAEIELERQGKIGLAVSGVVVGQLKQIADDEVRDVRRLKDMYFKDKSPVDGKSQEADTGDVIICDDFIVNEPPKSNGSLLKGAILGTGAVLAGAGLAMLMTRGTTPAVIMPPIPMPATAPATPGLPQSARVQVETRYDPNSKRHEMRFRIYPDGPWSEWQEWK